MLEPNPSSESDKKNDNKSIFSTAKEKAISIVPHNTSKYLSISKTYLGKGGFGEVKLCRFTNKESAMKIFSNRMNDNASAKNDSLREISTNMQIDAPWFPKFYGMAFLQGRTNNPAIFSTYAKGKKLSK